jgi:hypothetical protein
MGNTPHASCAAMIPKLTVFYNYIYLFAFSVLESINDDIATAMQYISYMGMSHSIMEKMVQVDSVMKPLALIISKMPYVGGVFQAMCWVYDNIVVYIVKPTDDVVKRLNDFVVSRNINDRLSFIQDMNLRLGLALLNFKGVITSFTSGLIAADTVCPFVVGNTAVPVCDQINVALDNTNNELKKLKVS